MEENKESERIAQIEKRLLNIEFWLSRVGLLSQGSKFLHYHTRNARGESREVIIPTFSVYLRTIPHLSEERLNAIERDLRARETAREEEQIREADERQRVTAEREAAIRERTKAEQQEKDKRAKEELERQRIEQLRKEADARERKLNEGKGNGQCEKRPREKTEEEKA